jgi:acetolactate synthase regulatory subunit
LGARNKKMKFTSKILSLDPLIITFEKANMIEKYSWKIQCNHTPETIDRIIMPIRKRGLSVISMDYKRGEEMTAVCHVEFEIEAAEYDRIFKNMLRIHDITKIERV